MGLGLRIKKRSFSFMLARRYLNPRRAMLSSFTLISLVGVLLGVLVLVVVMASSRVVVSPAGDHRGRISQRRRRSFPVWLRRRRMWRTM